MQEPKKPEPASESEIRQFYRKYDRKLKRTYLRAKLGNRQAAKQVISLLTELDRGLMKRGWRLTDQEERDEKGEPKIVPITDDWLAEHAKRRQAELQRRAEQGPDADLVRSILRKVIANPR